MLIGYSGLQVSDLNLSVTEVAHAKYTCEMNKQGQQTYDTSFSLRSNSNKISRAVNDVVIVVMLLFSFPCILLYVYECNMECMKKCNTIELINMYLQRILTISLEACNILVRLFGIVYR